MQLKNVSACASLIVLITLMNGCHFGNKTNVFRPAKSGPRIDDALVMAATSSQYQAGPSFESDAGVSVAFGERRASSGYRLTVLSFNMQHRKFHSQLPVIADRLQSDLIEVPDFLMLQEVKFSTSLSGQLQDTATVLASHLDYYAHSTKRATDPEGLAILSRYPFSYYAHQEFDSQTLPILIGFPRIAIMGEFNTPEFGKVRVVNVHLTNWGFESHVRRGQIRETLDWIVARERDVHADITILGGDFNFEPDDSEMDLIDSAEERGCVAFVNMNTDAPTKGSRTHFNQRLDYIFLAAPNRDVEWIGEKTLWEDGIVCRETNRRMRLSDHLPVLHEYEVASPLLAVGAGQH